jgi:cytochrome c oxidase subunit 1
VGGAIFVLLTVGSLLIGRKLEDGAVSGSFTPLPRTAPSAVAQSYGSMGFAAPGTFTLAMVFLVSFVLYYFINWKYLSTLWGLS